MRSMLAGFTTRGRAFVAAGAAAGVLGLGLGQRTLLSIGGVLIILPVLSVLAASRTRYRISWARAISPARVPAGHTASVSIQLDNVSRLPTGLLLAEDTVPYSIGSRPRFILDRIEPGGSRRLSYPIQPDHRGKYAIGPLQVRVADAFGLAKVGSMAAPPSTLVVTPAVTALPHTSLAGSWLGEGDARASTAAAAGEDDVVPRAYRDGDELRRVHWRSTARYGELMVRREEQRWRNRAVLFLDTRLGGHGGRGPVSSFEYAVSAAASIGVHLAREEMDTEFVTDAGRCHCARLVRGRAPGHPRRHPAIAELLAGRRAGAAARGHQRAVHRGRRAPERGEARQLATARRASGPAMALLLAVSTWAAERPGTAAAGETDEASRVLTAAGWRVATVTADTPLSMAWDMLNRSHMARGPWAAGPDAGPGLGGTAADSGNGAPAASTATPPAGAGASR